MIEFIGKKHLNSNFYKSIFIKQEDGYIRIKTVFDERFKNAELIKLDTNVITDQISNLSEFEKVKEIVLYFLRNNRICEIKQEDDKIVVNTPSFRKLVLQLGNEYQELLDCVINKYKNDRIQFLDENNEHNIYVRSVYLDEKFKIIRNVTNYYVGKNKYTGESAIVLTLLSKKGELISFDKEFIINYIKELINSSETEILFLRNEMGGFLHVCGKRIEIPLELSEEIMYLVFNRNYEINNMKSKQYKLEGIK